MLVNRKKIGDNESRIVIGEIPFPGKGMKLHMQLLIKTNIGHKLEILDSCYYL